MAHAATQLKYIELNGTLVPVVIRHNYRARNLIMRVESGRVAGDPDKVAVTLPRQTSVEQALRFVVSRADWVVASLARIPQRITICDGARIPYLGHEMPIRHDPQARRGVWCDDDGIHVSGQPEFLARRVTDWLKREARREITTRVADKAEMIGRPAGQISIRDTRSRWGSCAANGNLSFSWRLVLAPEFVLDYVITHEVCHIVEHNHGENFWRLVSQISPDLKQAKKWLQQNGERLHRYG